MMAASSGRQYICRATSHGLANFARMAVRSASPGFDALVSLISSRPPSVCEDEAAAAGGAGRDDGKLELSRAFRAFPLVYELHSFVVRSPHAYICCSRHRA